VTFTVTDPAGVPAAGIVAYRGSFARRDGMLPGGGECAPAAAANTFTCTAVAYLNSRLGPGRNALAGPWKVHIIARSADGRSFADVPAAGAFALLRQTRLTANAMPEPVKKGKTITVTGALTQSNWESRAFAGWSGQSVQLQFRKAGATAYTVVKTVKSTSRGALKTTVKATVDGSYRFVFPGSEQFAAGASSGDAVDVR
jgi:hypothetical protein